MTLQIRPLHPLFGAEVIGVDVRRIASDVFADLVAAFNDHSVLLFRGQRVDDAEQVAFSRRFGPLETTIRTVVSHEGYLPEIANLANVDADGQMIPANDKPVRFNAGNQMWHNDSSVKRVPALASLLSGRRGPAKGRTDALRGM